MRNQIVKRQRIVSPGLEKNVDITRRGDRLNLENGWHSLRDIIHQYHSVNVVLKPLPPQWEMDQDLAPVIL